MRCSWSEPLRRLLTPRLALALAVSAAVHGLLMGALAVRNGSSEARRDAGLTVLLSVAAAQERPPARAAAARAAQHYYSTSELDVVPGIMTRVAPEYPSLARVSGKVVLRLYIDERGRVEHVAVLSAEPPNTFEASARRAFLAARFTPGMKDGMPVKAQLTLQVDYTHPR